MLDKIITGFFIGILAVLWIFTRKYELPHWHRLVVYDKLGNQIRMELRTTFHTRTAAISFAKHYQYLLPQYDFVLESTIPQLRHRFLIH